LGSRTQGDQRARKWQRVDDATLEWLVVRLLDEADYWKSRAEELERELEELGGEVARLREEEEIAGAWRRGLASELEELALLSAVPRSGVFGGVPRAAAALGMGLALWVLLLLLAYGAYRLFAAVPLG
jgi:hypothetical protein